MPAIAWLDTTTGRTIPFGAEWEWPNAPVDPALLEELRDELVGGWHRENPTVLTPSRLLQPVRKTLIEAYVEYAVAPEEITHMFFGSLLHARLALRRKARGYLVGDDARMKFTMFGHEMEGEPDAVTPNRVDGAMDLYEDKYTTSGSLGFMFRDGNGTALVKGDHLAQASMYGLAFAHAHGIPEDALDTIRYRITYFCMPETENVKALGGWVKMPPSLPLSISVWNEARIGAHHPGWSEPEKPDQPAIPPRPVKENADLLAAAHDAIAGGKDPAEVIAAVDCECERRFRGKGKSYCDLQRACATLATGAPV